MSLKRLQWAKIVDKMRKHFGLMRAQDEVALQFLGSDRQEIQRSFALRWPSCCALELGSAAFPSCARQGEKNLGIHHLTTVVTFNSSIQKKPEAIENPAVQLNVMERGVRLILTALCTSLVRSQVPRFRHSQTT